MNVTVVGAGYVGLVTAACLADAGHRVFCLHDDAAAVALLQAGGVPIHEAGLQEMLVRNQVASRLIFATDVAASVSHSSIQLVAVGTPPDDTGAADLSDVFAAVRAIGRHATADLLVVLKSTVPVGTAEQVQAVLAAEMAARNPAAPPRCSVAVNPEFLREGSAVSDFQKPDRVLIGTPDTPDGRVSQTRLAQLYAPFVGAPDQLICMDLRSAELAKYAANAMLATRISFMNELATLAEALDADIEQVRRGIGSDRRIGPQFLQAGVGYGGGCLPKDVRALLDQGERNGQTMPLLSAVDAINRSRAQAFLDKVVARHGADLRGKTFAVWGLAFKPGTDDMRDAPSRALVAGLLARGAQVRASDPAALAAAAVVLQAELPAAHWAALSFHDQPLAAAHGADGVLIATEWPQYRQVDLARLKAVLRDAVVFDGRNMHEPATLAPHGLEWVGVGR